MIMYQKPFWFLINKKLMSDSCQLTEIINNKSVQYLD